MTFLNNLGNWADKTIKNFGTELGLPTMLHDIASVATNDKSWTADAFQLAGDAFKATAAGATYLPRKVVGLALKDVVLPVAQASYNLGGTYARQPLSALETGLATGNFEEAWKQKDQISPGQALAYLQSRWDPSKSELRGDFNIFDPNDRKIFDTNWQYRTLSGAYDTFFTTVTDPLGKVGKGLGLARKALITQPLGPADATGASLIRDFLIPKTTTKVTILSPETLAKNINAARVEGAPLNTTMQEFAKNGRVWARNHPMVKESNDADTLSYLLGEAKTVNEVADTFLATATKDTMAMGRLVQARPDLAFVYDHLKPVSELDKKVINNIPTNGFVEDENVLKAAEAHLEKAAESPYVDYLTRLTEKGADFSKRTFGSPAFEKFAINQAYRGEARALGTKVNDITNMPSIGVWQPTKYHPVVAVYNFAERYGTERPAGYFNSNDSDSFNEIKAFGNQLRNLVGSKANPIVERHLNDFIKAGDLPEARIKAAESFEEMAMQVLNKELGLSDETAQVIWGAYKGRRAVARAMIKDRKFLMTNDGTILKIPYLERQGGNALPMVDLENYSRVLKENSGLIKAIDGSHGIVDPDRDRYIAGIMNDVWKASVLLRLGYTVRNISEATMSILAKGYGLVAAADISREGMKRWYENRALGIERRTDQTLVAKGLREDSIKLRNELARTQMARAQYQRINDEIDNHMAAVELAFKRGQLTQDQALEFLNISSYRTGEWLHHGSATAIDALDNSRPLAMTYSDDIAKRYAESAMPTISASDIYKRKTGRPYAMPKNLRSAETGEPVKPPLRKESLSMQTIAADMRDGFINSVNNGNTVELLSLPSGQWRTIDPERISQELLVRGTFRVRKPGVEGQVISRKVYGQSVDLRNFNGSRVTLGLNDYPELKNIIGLAGNKPTSWQGKEAELLDWMRNNGVGKLTLPDTKANGRATVLVDPDMVEAGENKPTELLAKRRLDAIRNTRAVTSNQSKIIQMIQSTIENGGGTFKFMTGDVPKGGVAVAVRGGTFQYSLDAAKADPEAMATALAEHIENTLNKFENADHFGTWIAPTDDGTMHIWAEPVNVIEKRADAVKIGKQRNQVAVYDLNNFEEVKTGGTGDKDASTDFALGKGTKINGTNVTGGTQGVRTPLGGANSLAELNALANHIASGKYPTDGIVNLVRDLADKEALTRAKHENLLQKLDARIVEENRLHAPKKIAGEGYKTMRLYNGQVIEYPDAFHGELGQILAQRTDNADTYRLMADAPSQLFQARYGNMNEIRLNAEDPRYFAGYANHLNTFFAQRIAI